MDSQAFPAIYPTEKLDVPGCDLEPTYGPCRARQRRQDVKNSIFITVALLISWSCGSIPTSLQGHWHDLTTTGASEASGGRHTSFDKVDHPFHGHYNRPLNSSSSKPKVHIALLLVPGKHTVSRKASTLPLILNPGGPGGPGAAFASVAAPLIQKIVGEEQDIIGFDPRGVGATSPRADCFSHPRAGSDHKIRNFHRTMWAMAGTGIGNVNSSVDSLEKLDLRARTMAKLCGEKDAVYEDDSILRYTRTPSVTRDMLSIVDAWDEWRERIGDSDVEDNKVGAASTEDVVSLNTKDGVVNADHYVSPVWRGSIRDADKMSDSFSYYCREAEESCALYRSGDEVVVDIENRFQNILTRIKRHPITTVHPVSKQPIVITLSQVRMILFGILYSPNVGFTGVASVFDQLDRGNDDVLAQLFPLSEPEPFCAANIPAEIFPNEAQIAIMCSDKRYPFKVPLPELQYTYEKMANESSNTADPVTPLAAGVKMARNFVDAGLIEQHSMGHCSLAAVSKCTIRKIREYPKDGKLPPHPVKGDKDRELVDGKCEKCDADEWPFHPSAGSITVAGYGTQVSMEAQSMDAMKGLQGIFSKMKAWGQGLALDFDSIVLKPVH
ncbi:proteinase [Diplocarpon rosae]|nr:proteinase [Diplocarpon rosae]